MRRAGIAAVLLLGGCSAVTLPPQEFVSHREWPSFTASLETIARICNLRDVVGCAWRRFGVCWIFYPPPEAVTAEDMRRLHIHEPAHCEGWPGDHPGAHF